MSPLGIARWLMVPVCTAAFASVSFAWSTKEHIQLTRIAAERLIADPNTPAAMKDWLKAANRGALDVEGEKQYFLHQHVGILPRGADGLGFWATMPDMAKMLDGPRASEVEPFGVPEAQLHFTDLEFFMPDPADRNYKDDLSHKPKLSDFPRDPKDARWKQAGMLPFRVEDTYGRLVAALRAGRLVDTDGQYPHDEHAAKWAGYLAHYLEDNTQPQHATIDYKSRTYFSKAAGLRTPNVHWDVEGRLLDDEANDYMTLREEFWPLFVKALDEVKDPVETQDVWTATLEVMLKSYEALPLIGRAAMAGYHVGGTPEAPEGHAADTLDVDAFFHFKGSYGGREMTVLEMKAHQTAWAVKRVERVWRQAWEQSQQAATDSK